MPKVGIAYLDLFAEIVAWILPSPRSGQAFALTTLLFVLAACNPTSLVTGTPATSEADPQVAALRQVEADSEAPTDLYFQNGFPRFVSGSFHVEGADDVERAHNFLETYQDLYRIASPDLKLAVRRVSDGESETNVVFYQTYRGIEVFASEIVVTLNEDSIYSTQGGLLNGDLSLDTLPLLSAAQAEEVARADLGIPNALMAGVTTLMVFDQSILDDVPPEPHLAWRVTIFEPASQYLVDAHTGSVLFTYLLAQDGSGLEDYDFEEFDLSGDAPEGLCVSFGDHIGSEDGLERSWHSNPEAIAVWWFAQDVYRFYHDTFGRHSYDNDDSQLEVFIRGDVDGKGAAWDNSCELIVFEPGYVAQDVLAHEFTHGVIDSTSNLVYVFQSGALNESYADVMAALLDGNWTHGEGRVGGGGAYRDLSNPPYFGQPDRMSRFFRTTADNWGVHTNSGIPNKAAYLIAAGDTFNTWTITGIGAPKMGALFYATMTNLGATAQMFEARNATVARAYRWAASGTHGFTLFDACQVQNAFAAVELGEGDRDCDGANDPTDTDDDGDYIPDGSDNCRNVANPSQQDMDRDRIGDACDWDNDNDGVPNETDNCPQVSNADQTNSDISISSGSDGIGDACEDSDGDLVFDPEDNCPDVSNPDQRNNDHDSQGDACDEDDDNDGHPDVRDNCRFFYNDGSYIQDDADGDGVGDACDNCPNHDNLRQRDSDRDGIGDACEKDAGFILDVPFTFTINGGPAQVQNVLIPLCGGEDCQVSVSPDYLVRIVLTCPKSDVQVWVMDDTGNGADRASDLGDLSVLRFHPLGGRSYFLHFVFAPNFQEGGQVNCSILVSAGPADTIDETIPIVAEDVETDATPTPLSPPPALDSIETATLTMDFPCYTGPGPQYNTLSTLIAGTQMQIVGYGFGGGWLVTYHPTLQGQHCWIDEDFITFDVPLSELRLIAIPPKPTSTPSPTPQDRDTPVPCVTPINQPNFCG